MDFCKECHAKAFVYDEVSYDRICTYCGLCTAFELSDISRDVVFHFKQSSYVGENYFRIVLNKAIMDGLDISHEDKEWVVAQYRVLATIFAQNKADLGRKSFPSYTYVLRRILAMRNIDGRCIKLPKLQKTRDRMDETWRELEEVYQRTIFRHNARPILDTDFNVDSIDMDEILATL